MPTATRAMCGWPTRPCGWGRRRRPRAICVVERLLEAARRTGAAAVHPGYGFLSESAAFVRAVRDAGLIFVGPPAEAMERLGGKDSAKALLEPAGVPLVPGYHGADQADAHLLAEAERHRLPDADQGHRRRRRQGDAQGRAGGGFPRPLAACRREAKASFGDDKVLLERLIDRPRHVEVQVFADRHGECGQPVRARLHAAAPAPEDHRGGAGARA